MHHVDVHVSNLTQTRRLFDAVMPIVGYELRSQADDLVTYWKDKQRPSIGFDPTGVPGSGSMRIAFAVATRRDVDDAAAAARKNGAQNIEGPSIHPEYGDDYYAVFFEDGDGNLYEIVCDPENA